MQNSTQWFNLYSIESKFNINIYQSVIKWLLLVLCISLLFVALLAVYFFESAPSLVLSVSIGFILLLFLGGNIRALKQSHRYIEKTASIPLLCLDLTIEGEVLFSSDEKYFIHPSSRCGLFGCWLILMPDNGEKPKRNSLFVFKDSVSPKNYARLCRTITRNHLKITQGTMF